MVAAEYWVWSFYCHQFGLRILFCPVLCFVHFNHPPSPQLVRSRVLEIMLASGKCKQPTAIENSLNNSDDYWWWWRRRRRWCYKLSTDLGRGRCCRAQWGPTHPHTRRHYAEPEPDSHDCEFSLRRRKTHYKATSLPTRSTHSPLPSARTHFARYITITGCPSPIKSHPPAEIPINKSC